MTDAPRTRDPAGKAFVSDEGSGFGVALLLGLGTFAVGTDAFIVAAFLPAMADGLAVTPAMAGYSVTAFALSYAILAPIIATLAAPLPRRALLAGALVFLAFTNIGSALSPSLGTLIVTRVAAAAAAAAYSPNAVAAAGLLARPAARARILAIVIGGLTVATALGVPLGRIASMVVDWRAALGLVAALALIAAVGVLAIMPRMTGGPRISMRRRLLVLGHPGVTGTLFLTVLGMSAAYAPYAFTIPILDALSIADDAIVYMLVLYGLGAIAGNYVSGIVTDRWGTRRVLCCAYALMVMTFACLAVSGVVPVHGMSVLIGALMVCWGVGVWSQNPAQIHRLIAIAPQEAPLVVALNASAVYVGIALGTALGGATIGLGASATLGCGMFLALGALLYARSCRSRSRQQHGI